MNAAVLILLLVFSFGLLLGSFLNVCISRLPAGRSIMFPPSSCPYCNRPIRWFDNVPLLSWILLRRRCRSCSRLISLRYPAVELFTAIWFVVAALHMTPLGAPGSLGSAGETGSFNGCIEALGLAIFGFLLTGLIVMDWETKLLPDSFTLTGIALAFFLVCTRAIFLGPHQGDVILNTTHQLRMSSPGSTAAHGNLFLTGTESLIFGRVAAIVAVSGLLLLIRWGYKLLRNREGLGLGDVKLIAMIAAFLGFWPAMVALFLGVLSGSFYAVFLLVRGRASGTTRLPLGSFLGAGGLAAAIFGSRLIHMYTTMLR